MDPPLQEILDATVSPGVAKEIPWGQLRPLCDGATEADRMLAFMHWCARHGRVATAPEFASPTGGLPDAALISIGRQ
ncbi:hypothetical protein [Burkholderia contaminans]|uniref:hypothetical protein n=1 Tax=Burkholderia contaminans TaxID=488447 RepID=UPI002D7E467E|nr:hypothetical protein [Burkholderia contaminans]